MYDLSLIIILYKKNVLDSDTLISLPSTLNKIEGKKFHISIFDNSEQDSVTQLAYKNFTKNLPECACVNLISTFSNESLGIIYNQAIASVDSRYYCILDHDTKLDEFYFSTFFDLSEVNNVNLFVPKILEKDELLYSPKRQKVIVDIFNRCKVNKFTSEVSGMVSSTDFFSIMSGIIIKKTVFNDGYYFNEKIKLYGLDNLLFEYYNRNYDECYILPIFLKHSISYLEKEDIDTKIFRFKERNQSAFFISKLTGKSLIRTYVSLFISTMTTVIKLRSLKPIKFLNEICGFRIG